MYILTRPNMSPSRPRLTTSTLETIRKPRIIQSRKKLLPGWSGSSLMPRKICGIAIRMIDESMVASSTPMVVFDSTTHL